MAKGKKVQMITSDEILVEMSKNISILVNDKLINLVETLNQEFKKYCSRVKDFNKDFKEVDEALLKFKKIEKYTKDTQEEIVRAKESLHDLHQQMISTLNEMRSGFKPIKIETDKIKNWEEELNYRIQVKIDTRVEEVEQYFINRFAGFLKDTDTVAKEKIEELKKLRMITTKD